MSSIATASVQTRNVADIYRALPIPPQSKCIRLLTVYPTSASDGPDGPIHCDLSIADLNLRPQFTALSYVWGRRAVVPKTINCKGCAIPVTDSCHSALVHLRRNIATTITIWIDRVCINQEDKVEKAQQIPLMGEIYKGAQFVWVWLGAGTPATDRAMNYLRTTGFLAYYFDNGAADDQAASKPRVWAAFWSATAARWALQSQPLLSLTNRESWRSVLFRRLLGSAASIPASYDDLDQLLSRSWITRIWTYQEIMLSTNPIVVCGDQQVPWSTFASSIIFVDYNKLDHLPLASKLSTWKKVALIRDHISTLHRTDLIQPNRLRKYQTYVHNISQKYAVAKRWKILLFVSCLFMLGAFIALMAFFGVVNRGYHPPRNSTSTSATNLTASAASSILSASFASATACAMACQSQRQTNEKACIEACFTPNSTVVAASSLVPRPHYDYRTALPLLLLPAIILTIFAIDRLMARNLPFLAINVALRQEEMRMDRLDDIVDGICTRKVTNPLDMAFGFRSVLGTLLASQLPAPNYETKKGPIYKEFAADLLRATRSLHLLIPAAIHRVPPEPPQPAPPSWVPDWHKDFPIFWLRPYLSFQELKTAAPGSTPIQNLDPDGNTLVVRGRQICTIASCSDFQPTSDTYQVNERESHVKNLEILLEIADKCNGSVAPELHDLLRNRLNHPNLPDNITQSHMESYTRFLLSHHGENPSQTLALLTNAGSAKTLYQDILRTHIAICNSMVGTGRRIFWTSNLLILSLFPYGHGKIVRYGNLARYDTPLSGFESWGICTNDTTVGDRVLIISGLSIPLIIRQSQNCSQIISPAIVAGAMEGQAWERDDAGGEAEVLDEIRLA